MRARGLLDCEVMRHAYSAASPCRCRVRPRPHAVGAGGGRPATGSATLRRSCGQGLGPERRASYQHVDTPHAAVVEDGRPAEARCRRRRARRFRVRGVRQCSLARSSRRMNARSEGSLDGGGLSPFRGRPVESVADETTVCRRAAERGRPLWSRPPCFGDCESTEARGWSCDGDDGCSPGRLRRESETASGPESRGGMGQATRQAMTS